MTMLGSLVGPKEYISRIQSGSIAILYRSDTLESTEQRISNYIKVINTYIAQMDPDWSNLFHAGVCRLKGFQGRTAKEIITNAKDAYIYATAQDLPYYITSGSYLSDEKKTKLLAHVDDALKNKEFKAHLQFIYSNEYNCFCGAELLSRWQNPEFGLLPPGDYIELLKESEKIVEHDYAIFEIACQQQEFWQSTKYANLFLSCNFTRISCSRPGFSDRIKEISDKYSFPHENILIEITEDSLSMNSKVLSKNIEAINLMDFGMAFDDMGAGFSSLADLYDNEIDVVKIERAFLVSCNTPRRKRMLKDLISLIHNSGTKVISEGVESEEHKTMLDHMECDMVQGFYYSRVMPLYQAGSFLSDKKVSQFNSFKK